MQGKADLGFFFVTNHYRRILYSCIGYTTIITREEVEAFSRAILNIETKEVYIEKDTKMIVDAFNQEN